MTRQPVYILAGGRSSRFGSDKARAPVAGEPMIVRVAQMAAPVAESITVVADRTGKYDDLGLVTIRDDTPHLGPLGGLATALRHRGDGWLLLLSCDLLAFAPSWVESLWAAKQDGAMAIAFFHERWEPLLALYHTDALGRVQSRLIQDDRSMQGLLNDLGKHSVAVRPPVDWPQRLQANRPDQLPLTPR